MLLPSLWLLALQGCCRAVAGLLQALNGKCQGRGIPHVARALKDIYILRTSSHVSADKVPSYFNPQGLGWKELSASNRLDPGCLGLWPAMLIRTREGGEISS